MNTEEENIHEGCEDDIQALKEEIESLRDTCDQQEELLDEIRGILNI